jgi:VanZ family protein
MPRRATFAALATLGYVLAVVVASTYPLGPWRWPDARQLWIQLAEWPRYYTYVDVVANVLGYVPLGLFAALWLQGRSGLVRGTSLAMVASAVMSCALELVQGALPARVPSGLDFFCNAMGGIVGAWLALVLALQPDGLGRLKRWRHRAIRHGSLGDLALVALACWVFLQFRPDVWLFAVGSPGRVDPSPLGAYSATTHAALEAASALSSLVALAALMRAFAMRTPLRAFLALVLLGLAVRSGAVWLLSTPQDALLWLTPGNTMGLLAGMALGVGVCLAPVRTGVLAGLLALIAAASLLALAPENPYASQTAMTSRMAGSHLRNIAGSAQWLAVFWPWLAAVLLVRRHTETRRLEATGDGGKAGP